MFRYYDFECGDCRDVHPLLIQVPAGQAVPQWSDDECPNCGSITRHERRMSCPAPYMGEKVYNPSVSGGKYDTMGYKKAPKIPELPASAYEKGADGKKRIRIDAMKDRMHSPEYKDAMRVRQEVATQNTLKRKRAAAMERGENINMRRDRLPGDPKITA